MKKSFDVLTKFMSDLVEKMKKNAQEPGKKLEEEKNADQRKNVRKST